MPIPSRALASLALLASLARAVGSQEPARQLDTLRVVSRVDPVAAGAQRSVEVIDRRAIERQPVRSVTDLIATALGADVQRRSPVQADVALRGSSLGQVLVLVDGVRVSDLQTGHFDLDLAVPLDLVDRVEILRGPGSALYGPDAVGGVINIVTRTGASWREARVHGGTFATVGGGAGLGTAAGDAARTSIRLGADGERSSGHRAGTDYEALQAAARVARGIGGGRASLDVGVGARNFGAADFYAPAPSYERTRSQTVAMHYRAPDLRGWDASAVLSSRRHTDDFILRRADPAFYRNRHRTLQHSVEVWGRHAIGDVGGLSVGAEAFDARLSSTRLGDRREMRTSGFVEATAGDAATASLSAGLRVDHSTSLGTIAAPSLAAAVPLGRLLRMRGSLSRGVRAPSWTERYYEDPANVATAALQPERFRAAEVGARALPRWGFVDAALFIRSAAGMIDWVRPVDAPETEPWRTANLEHATYRGVEVAMRAFDLRGFTLGVDAVGIRFVAGAADSVVGKYALRPITRAVGTRIGRRFGDRLQVELDARQSRRAMESAYLHVNVRTGLQLGPATLHVDVTNLADADYLDAAARPVAGRAVFVGLAYR